MEVRVRERLVGALVLVAIVVLLVPAVLQGPERAPAASTGQANKSVEVLLEDGDRPVGNETLMPEPAAPQPAAAPAGPLPAPAASADSAPSPANPVATQPASTVADAGAAAATPAWAIQLGAFSTREKAERLVADLRKRGYAAFVLEYRASGKVLHRVRVGPEQDRERANAIALRLRKDGFQPVVAPHP